MPLKPLSLCFFVFLVFFCYSSPSRLIQPLRMEMIGQILDVFKIDATRFSDSQFEV